MHSLADVTQTVEVIVGDSPSRTWVIHQSLLTSASKVAKSSLSWGFKEKEGNLIKFPEHDPDVFEIFFKYLYTNAIDTRSLDKTLQLYVLADKLQALALCTELHARVSFLFQSFTSRQIEYVLDNTSAPDPMRFGCLQRICRDIRSTTWFSDLDFAQRICERYSSEVLAALMGRYDQIILAPLSPEKALDSKGKGVDRGELSQLTSPLPSVATSSVSALSWSTNTSSPWGSVAAPSKPTIPLVSLFPSTASVAPVFPTAASSHSSAANGAGFFEASSASTKVAPSQSIFGPRSLQSQQASTATNATVGTSTSLENSAKTTTTTTASPLPGGSTQTDSSPSTPALSQSLRGPSSLPTQQASTTCNANEGTSTSLENSAKTTTTTTSLLPRVSTQTTSTPSTLANPQASSAGINRTAAALDDTSTTTLSRDNLSSSVAKITLAGP